MKKLFYIFLIIFFKINNLNASDFKDNFDKPNIDVAKEYFLKLNGEDKNFAAKVLFYLIRYKYFCLEDALKFHKENIEDFKDKKSQIYDDMSKIFQVNFWTVNFLSITFSGQCQLNTKDVDACYSYYEFCWGKLDDNSKNELWIPEQMKKEFKTMIEDTIRKLNDGFE